MATSRKKRKERRRVSGKKRAAEHTSGFVRTTFTVPEGTEMFQLKKEGSYRIDVVPFEAQSGNPYADKGELHFERTFFVHRGIGPMENAYLCPRKTSGKSCPICDHRAELARDPDADDKLISDLAPKERQLWNIVDHSDEGKLKLWDVSFYLFGKLLDSRIKNAEEDDDYEFFADPDEGLTLRLTVEEKKIGSTSFCAVEAIDFKPRSVALAEELVESALCLDDLLIELSYDKLKSIFLQIDANGNHNDDDDDDEVEEEKPKPKAKAKPKAKPKAKAKAKAEPKAEEDDDDDWDDDEPDTKDVDTEDVDDEEDDDDDWDDDDDDWDDE